MKIKNKKYAIGDKIIVKWLPEELTIHNPIYQKLLNERIVGTIVSIDNDNAPYNVEFTSLNREMYFFAENEICYFTKLDKILD